MTKPVKSLSETTKPPGRFKVGMHGSSNHKLMVWGSDNRSDFVDVISVGPISNIVSTQWDGVTVSSPFLGDVVGPLPGPFTHPDSSLHFHNGDFSSRPWGGNYPYVERSERIGVNAEVRDSRDFTDTEFTRQVSGKGVEGLRLMFNTTQYVQVDDQNRRKHAAAFFEVEVLDNAGTVVASETTSRGVEGTYYYAKNPTMVPLTILAPSGYEDQTWQYKVKMHVFGRNNGVPVGGTWVCATVTEFFRETQWYSDVAYCSGSVVSTDTSGAIPVRTYIVEGYKVAVPVFEDVLGTPTFLGDFTNETSNSHAWNILAVLTDDKWAGDLPIDKINLNSFLDFEEYCAFDINGERRHTFSQHLIKATNYFKLAAQMAGTADAKLYEDTAGRVGILIDEQTDDRRVITSYDIVDEHVKRTTVPTTKKLNYVQVEFEDENNEYGKTILHSEDSDSITKNGIIKNEIKLDTCTLENEAKRIADKTLAVSQFISDTYHFTAGPSHEDLQIGDIVELYDRKHSNVNYCGKISSGSTTTTLNIHPATPIDLTDIENVQMDIAIWTGTEVLRGTIDTWTAEQIVLTAPLSESPAEFLSFGIQQLGDNNLSPTLMKVMDLSDAKGGLKVSCISYNHSLYSYVENQTPLVLPPTRFVVDNSSASDIYSLTLLQFGNNLRAQWGVLAGYNYTYSLEIQQLNSSGINEWSVLQTGTVPSATTLLDFPFPLNSGLYRFVISAVSLDGNDTGSPGVVTYELVTSSGGTLLAPDSVGIYHVGDPDYIDLQYTGRDFVVGWTMTDPGNDVYEFKLTLLQNSITHVVTIADPTLRQHTITEQELRSVYGDDFERDFIVDLFAIDDELLSGPSANVIVTNDAPPAPALVVRATGDVSLSTGATLGDDVTESVVYVWESSDSGSIRPADALVSRSTDLLEHNVTGNFIEQDGRDYVYEAGWVDTFGDSELNYTRAVVQFNPDFEVPDPVVLTQVVPVTETSILLRWTHDLVWLVNLTVEYRLVAEDINASWTTFGTNFVFPLVGGETNRGYDSPTGVGYVVITGLTRNSLYEFRVLVSNTSSADSEYSNIIEGEAFPDVTSSVDLDQAIQDALDIEVADLIEAATGEEFEIDPRDLLVEGVIDAFADYDVNAEVFNQTAITESENAKRIDSIDQIRADLDDPVVGIFAQVLETKTALAATDAAFAARVVAVDAEFGTTNANVTTNTTAIAAESSARASEISTVNASIGDLEADIVRIDEAILDVEGGQATSVTALTIALNDEIATRESEIIRVDQAIIDGDDVSAAATAVVAADLVTEEAARAAAITSIENAYIAADAVVAGSVDTVQANLDSEETSRIAEVARVDQAIIDGDAVNATSIDTVAADLVTEEAARAAAITSVETAYIAGDAVIATSVDVVQANLDDYELSNNAEIATIQSVNVTQDTAIALNGTNITAEIADRVAEISRVETAFADADTAIIATADLLRVDVDGNTATSSSNTTAIATETSARIAADNVLTASVDSNTDEIAAARDEAIAAIGYCEITPGVVSNHETKALCEAATGTWIDAPFAQAVNNVEVVSGGNSTTVGSFYEAYVDLEGDVVGQATLGVDSGGVFTGMQVVGGTSHSEIIFRAGTLEFQDSGGTPQLTYSGGDWTFTGDITGASGTFSGTIYAENIEGDVTDSVIKTTTERDWDGAGDPANPAVICSVTVTAMPFERTITCAPINFEMIGNSEEAMFSISGIATGVSYTRCPYNTYQDFSLVTYRKYFTLIAPSAVIPANVGGVVNFNVGVRFPAQSQYYTHRSQSLMISIFKSGGTLV